MSFRIFLDSQSTPCFCLSVYPSSVPTRSVHEEEAKTTQRVSASKMRFLEKMYSGSSSPVLLNSMQVLSNAVHKLSTSQLSYKWGFPKTSATTPPRRVSSPSQDKEKRCEQRYI